MIKWYLFIEVHALQSLGSFKDFVIGLLFTISSTSHIGDDNLSSSNTC